MIEYKVSLVASCRVLSKDESPFAHALINGYRASLFLNGEYGPCQLEISQQSIKMGDVATVVIQAIVSQDLAFELKQGVKFELMEVPARIAECTVISITKSPS